MRFYAASRIMPPLTGLNFSWRVGLNVSTVLQLTEPIELNQHISNRKGSAPR
jgi:hypothetical protein